MSDPSLRKTGSSRTCREGYDIFFLSVTEKDMIFYSGKKKRKLKKKMHPKNEMTAKGNKRRQNKQKISYDSLRKFSFIYNYDSLP